MRKKCLCHCDLREAIPKERGLSHRNRRLLRFTRSDIRPYLLTLETYGSLLGGSGLIERFHAVAYAYADCYRCIVGIGLGVRGQLDDHLVITIDPISGFVIRLIGPGKHSG